mgnify:CR=1 FL=1
MCNDCQKHLEEKITTAQNIFAEYSSARQSEHDTLTKKHNTFVRGLIFLYKIPGKIKKIIK